MTVPTDTTFVAHVGNDVTTVFPYAFCIPTTGDADVFLRSASTKEVTTQLVYGVDFTIDGVDPSNDTGGNVTYPLDPLLDPLDTETEIVIRRVVEYTQDLDLRNQKGYFPESTEQQLDRLEFQIQQLRDEVDRAVRLPKTYPVIAPIASPHLLANQALLFNASGNPVGGTPLVATIAPSVTRDFVYLEEFDAVGDDTTDDTDAILAAIDTGLHVIKTQGKRYKTSATIEIANDYQQFIGSGVICPHGNFDVVKVTGGAEGVEIDLIVDGPSHSGGWALVVEDANRTRIRRFIMKDGFNALKVQKANTTSLDWMHAVARGAGIKWYGNNANRSDLFFIDRAIVSVSNHNYGFDWDGNCNSLEMNYLGIICGSGVSAANGYGAIVRNTSGEALPFIGKFKHLEVDYCGTHALDLTVGADFDVIAPYILGATGSGIRVGASINNRDVRVLGGKSRGNTRYGIEALGGVVLYDGATDLQANTIAKTLGPVWAEPIRVALSDDFYLTNEGSGPVIVFDTNRYMSYDQGASTVRTLFDSVELLGVGTERVSTGVPLNVPSMLYAARPMSPALGDEVTFTDSDTAVFNDVIAGSGTDVVTGKYNGVDWVVA